jgi:hypothetical protein
VVTQMPNVAYVIKAASDAEAFTVFFVTLHININVLRL